MEIIAEIGQNHNGDMVLAKEMIAAAKEAGADVVKFQVYDAKKLFPKENNPWFDYNCKTELSKDKVFDLASECQKIGIEFMASVFDLERVGWLEEAGVRRHKVASRSINDQELIKRLVSTNKEILVSLGMWTGTDFPVIPGSKRVKFLYCVSLYPTPLEALKLSHIDFHQYAGFSDHSIGTSAALFAVSQGAEIIEKHFTLDKNLYGPDHSGSMTPDELRILDVYRKDFGKLK